MSTGRIATSGTKPARVPATPSANTGSASPPQSRAQPAARERRIRMPRLIGIPDWIAAAISPPSGVRQAVVPVAVAKCRLQDLAGGGVRYLVDEDDVVRHPPFRDPRPDEVE